MLGQLDIWQCIEQRCKITSEKDDNGLYWGIQNKEKFIDEVLEDNSKIP